MRISGCEKTLLNECEKYFHKWCHSGGSVC
jgi:hypothetical protein